MRKWPFGDLPMFGYDVIVADPPWRFDLWSEAGQEKSADAHYDTMPMDEISALPVGELARRDCLLLMWTCGWAMAEGHAQHVAKAWGFKPVSEIIWLKTTKNGKPRMGPGYRVRTMHEPVLVCTLGKPAHRPFPSVIRGVAREHSRKPDEFYHLVKLHSLSAMRRVDLFSRQAHDGFDAWGNEVGKFQTGEAA